MDIRLGNSDNRLIQALIERWWQTTHTFLFPFAEIGVTPLDFTMLTSLSIGRYLTQVPYDDTWSILFNARQLLPNIDSSHIKCENVSIAHLRTYLTVAVDREDDITIVRAFIFFMIGHLWLQMANDTHGLDTAVTTGDAITGFVQLLSYWFYEYCGVGHPIVKKEVTGEVRIPLDPPLSMSPHISPGVLNEIRQAGYMLTNSQRMGNIDLFGPTALKAGIAPVVAMSMLVHSLSQEFSLPGEAEGPDLGWHMEWTGRRQRLPIAHLRDPPPMSSSYGAKELWHLTHGMQRFILAESTRDAQRLQEVEDELAILPVGKLTV
ncbi:hypothetical protein GIB67_030929 [Kingdonia uniflora]|uniref:Aminotransferase-like plant mobile domain-containing protein n=1 Tax=Kingdonia uniflora TaxID=39325 RepID=A0A7J7L3G8_9MAGN|nr:hypothetical protein GIB67_030929 [Kingdonia uniflora]